MISVRRVVALVAALSTALGVSLAPATSAAASFNTKGTRSARPAPPPPHDLGQTRLHPERTYGYLTEDQVRHLIATGKVRKPSVQNGPERPEFLARSQDAVPGPAGLAAQGLTVAPAQPNETSYSVNGTIYAIGQTTSGSLSGPVTDGAFGGDGSRAVIEYADAQWQPAVFGNASWGRTSIGVKSLENGYFAPISFDAQGRAVPATLQAVSANGQWVVYTGPDMDLMYADGANLGKVYIMDVLSQRVQEMPLSGFGSTPEHPFVPTITSITDDGTRLTWQGCIANVGGQTCAAQVPGDAWISADGSTIVYQSAARVLYRTSPGGGAGTLVSTDQSGAAVPTEWPFQSWAMSPDGSVIAYSTPDPNRGEVSASYIWDSGQVTPFLWGSYDTRVVAVSGNGSLIAFSHPYGIDSRGFETQAITAWDRAGQRFVDFTLGEDNQPLPSTSGNSLIGLSSDGSRVALWSYDGFAYVFDRTGAPPAELMQKVQGTDAYGWNYDAWAADPVNTRTGAVELSVTDVTLPSRGTPVVLSRSYSSDLSCSGRLGPGWIDALDSAVHFGSGGTATVQATDGSVLDFTLESGAWVTGSAVHASLKPNDAGWVLTSADGTEYTYGSDGRLTGSRTSDGVSWTVSWNGATQTVTTTAGTTLSLQEDGGLLRTVTLPDGRQVHYGYDGGRLTSVTDAAGGLTSYAYDDAGRMTRLTDPANNAQFTNTYDIDGRIESQTDATGDVTWFYWDQEQQVSYVFDENNDVWAYGYRGPVLMWFEQPDGLQTSFVYDGSLNVIAKTEGNTTDTFSYDQAGNPTAAAWSDGTSLQLQYDSTRHPISVTDANGSTTEYVYDTRGHLLETHLADGRVASNRWDPTTGLQTASVSPAGRVTSYEHNAAGQLTSIVTPEGRRSAFQYDALGRLESFVTPHADNADSADYTWGVTYSADGLTAVVTDPLGNQSQTATTALGQLSQLTDARGNSTAYAYTPNQQLATIVDATGAQTNYTYDHFGWLSSREDQNGNVQHFQNDALGRVTGLQLPDGSAWAYGYSNGRLAGVQDPNAAANSTAGTTSLSYDSLGRLIAATPQIPTEGGGGPVLGLLTADDNQPPAPYLPSPAATVSMHRDPAGRIQSLAVWDPAQGKNIDSVVYGWDITGRPTSVERDGRTVNYQWDADDRLTTIADGSGDTATRTYTDDGLLASITVGGATVSYQYDEAGNLVLTQYPDGTREETDHDVLGRTTRTTLRVGDSLLRETTYEYDAESNPIHVVTDGIPHFARYDAKNELTDWCTQSPCTEQASGIHYTYDSTGNRLTQTNDGATTSYSYDSNNRLVSVTSPDGAVRQMAYDAAGRLIGDNDRHYQYDTLGRLTSVTDPTIGTIAYTYTADGLLDTRTSAGATTTYQWDTTSGAPRLLSESVGGSTMTYSYGQGVVRASADSQAAWAHTDTIGSLTSLTFAGASVGSVEYDPFGQVTSSGLPQMPFTLPGFAGAPTDPDTGLLFMGARVYDPTIGRFLTFDPDRADLYSPAVSNYVYVDNRPTVLVDPTGRHGAVANTCAAWLCFIYAVNDGASKASDAFGLTALGAVGVSLLLPPAAGAAPMFAGAAKVMGLLAGASGSVITAYDAANGGDWKCEAGHTASQLVAGGLASELSDVARGSLAKTWTRAQKLALWRATNAGVAVTSGSYLDGILGECDRAGG